MNNQTRPSFTFRKALTLSATALLLSTLPAQAHQADEEFDRFENAVQCAGMWFGEAAAFTLKSTNRDERVETELFFEHAQSFRRYALETGEGSAEEVDYLISVWQQYFFRLAVDSGASGVFPPSEGGDTAQWASTQFTRHARYCQGFGLTLGPAWGFH